VHRCDHGLNLVAAGAAECGRAFDQRDRLADAAPVPQCAVLVLEEYQPARGVQSRRPPCQVEPNERQ